MAILTIAEHDNSELKEATLNAIAAGAKISNDVHLLIAGDDCVAVVEQAVALDGVTKVLVAEADLYADPLAENIASLVASIGNEYTHIVAASTAFSKNFLPRVSALLDVALISEVVDIEAEDIFRKPIYSGSAIATIQSLDPIKVISVRPTAFEALKGNGGAVNVEPVTTLDDMSVSKVVGSHFVQSLRPELSSARVVIAGGRGIGSAENFSLLESLGDKLGAAIGATRAAVDAGFVENDLQVGQTGKVVAPELYIAIGISGAIQHTSGIKDSKTIVAINSDPEAPIFQASDYAFVADYSEVLPELLQKL